MIGFDDALLARADDRLILGHRLSEWCGHAPVLEEDLALANVALDLLGQAQRLYEWLGARDEPKRGADELVFFRGPTEYKNLLLVEQPNRDFANTLVRQYLFGSYDLMWLAAFAKHPACAGALAAWVKGAERESRYHLRHSEAWIRRLGDGTEESHERCQRALDALWPYSTEFFAPDPCIEGEPNDRLHAEWRNQVAATLEEATLALPETAAIPTSGGREGIHSEHLERLLSEMQSLARAFPGAEW